jgi:hypothetical protein
MQQLANVGSTVDEQESQTIHDKVERFTRARFPTSSFVPDDVDAFGAAEMDLRTALTPLHEDVIQQLVAHNPGGEGMKFVVELRGDVLAQLREQHCPKLSYLDVTLAGMLKGWFSEGFLQLERVTWQSPGELLEKIGDGEKVHRMKLRFTELKARLGQGRRCFAFMHPNMPGEPLVFIHVALAPSMASTLHELERVVGEGQEGQAGAAMFWSISATQPGLVGVDLGAFLIKKVVTRLQQEWPSLAGADPSAGMPQQFVFSTLSPVPGFTDWLERRLKEEEAGEGGPLLPSEVSALKTCWQVGDVPPTDTAVTQGLLKELSSMKSKTRTATAAVVHASGEGALKQVLMRLCARYLLETKRRGRAACPVANFHIRNGATLQRINWGADLSSNGLSQSCGLMVNYHYELPRLEANHTAYVRDFTIARSAAMDSLLSDG